MREITGRHVLFFTVGAFGVIIAVNVVMAYKAITTFPGLEVDNSYVASQEFDAKRRAQEALGWNVTHDYDAANGRLVIAVTDAQGLPARIADFNVLLGRTTEAKDDQTPAFTEVAGKWEASVDLPPGKWLLKLSAVAGDGTPFEQRLDFFVRG